jgi:hypothetical protein
MTRTRRRSLAIAAVFAIVALAAGCGGDHTTASKSAAAFDAAVKKGGMPAAGEAHGGHGQVANAERPHAASDSNDGSNMAGMDHSRMPGTGTAPGAHPAAGAGSSMAGMSHSTMPGMDHRNMAAPQGMNMAPPAPEPPTAVARPGQTAATLQPTELDQPPTTSVREAARAAAMAEEMASGGHGMMHGTYRQIDAGRDDVTPSSSSSGAEHEGHHAAPAPPPPPGAGAHRDHSAPASPRPQSSPRASPSPDPHRMHSMPPSPRPTPTPRPEERQR